MPHLENCRHVESGWCADCVKEMGEENQSLRLAILEVSRITFEEHSEGGEIIRTQLKESDREQFDLAQKMVGEACRKYLI